MRVDIPALDLPKAGKIMRPGSQAKQAHTERKIRPRRPLPKGPTSARRVYKSGHRIRQQRLKPKQKQKKATNENLKLKPVDTYAACKSRIIEVRSVRSRGIPIKEAMTPSQTLHQYRENLAEFEVGEILDFKDIYYLGTKGSKNNRAKVDGSQYLFDDAKGDYLHVNQEHICYRYEVLGVLGKGSFGRVLRCFDHKSGAFVALKIIRSQKRFQKQAAVEMTVLKQLRDRDTDGSANIIHIKHSMTFRGHLCMTFDVFSLNLYEYMKSKMFRRLPLTFVKSVALQLVQCLQFLASNGIIHCDLKPENILLVSRKRSKIKVIDFGSSCYTNKRVYTYIQSRFYRSPEIMLGLSSGYGVAIDWWSLGCVLAEVCTGKPIFPGQNESEQMSMIAEVLGNPPRKLLSSCTRKNHFFYTCRGSLA